MSYTVIYKGLNSHLIVAWCGAQAPQCIVCSEFTHSHLMSDEVVLRSATWPKIWTKKTQFSLVFTAIIYLKVSIIHHKDREYTYIY